MKESVRFETDYSKIYDLFLTSKRTGTFVITKTKLVTIVQENDSS